jgi:phage terminase large subunit
VFIPRIGNSNWHGLFPLPDHPQDNLNICFGCKTEVWARLTRPHVQSPKEAAIEAKEKAEQEKKEEKAKVIREKKEEKAKAVVAAAEEKTAKVIAKAQEKITHILK